MNAWVLKNDYKDEWPRANTREYIVLSSLRGMLVALREEARRRVERERDRAPLADRLLARASLEARLTGLGAGSSRYIEETYHGLEDAFDISIIVNGEKCCFVEVTGVDLEGDLKEIDGRRDKLYCVGTWKLEKARKLLVLGRTWFAFVISETSKIRFIKASYLDALASAEEPRAVYARLRARERESVCVSEKLWKSPRRLYPGLRAAVKRFLILQQIKR